jgi:hypothetical protein
VRLLLPVGTIALFLAAGCVSVGTAPPSTTARLNPPRANPRPPPPRQQDGPDSFHVDQAGVWKADPDSWSVLLTWDPAPGFEAEHYEVTRNGTAIEDDLSSTRLVDGDVVPQTPYEYEVTAVDAAGMRTASSSVKVDTHAPPAADARLEGRFAMKMHIAGQSGLQGGATGFAMVFLYDPACAKGACDVTWSRKGPSGLGAAHASPATPTTGPSTRSSRSAAATAGR